MSFQPSELVLDKAGKVYHLGIQSEQLATKIIIVGDQGRVGQVSAFFESLEHQSQHREFVVHTGWYQHKRITVLSTGIGTDNIDIVVNELDVLANVDLSNRKRKDAHTTLEIVRIGTCGILQPEIDIHSYIISEAAIGLDNVAHFYEIPFTQQEKEQQEKLPSQIDFPEAIIPYYIASDPTLTQQLESEKTHKGITVTSSGFYGPQGRELNLAIKAKNLNSQLTAYRSNEQRIVNFEMESSALFALSRGLNHRSSTICLGIANRLSNQFSQGYEEEMNGLIRHVLDRI